MDLELCVRRIGDRCCCGVGVGVVVVSGFGVRETRRVMVDEGMCDVWEVVAER